MSRMTDQIGRVLSGRYRLIAPIGTGASAQVFLADDVRLRRRVAVKVLHAALAEDDAFLRRFRAEAQAAAALNHPNIVAVYDWGDDDGAPVHRHRVPERREPPRRSSTGACGSPRRRRCVVGLEATRALDYAHRRGFVHRDIKPANLLFGEDGRLRDRRLRPGPRPGRGGVDRAAGRGARDRPLRLARAGAGPAGRRQGRRLLARPRPDRVRHRHRALRRRHHHRHPDGPGRQAGRGARGARPAPQGPRAGRPPRRGRAARRRRAGHRAHGHAPRTCPAPTPLPLVGDRSPTSGDDDGGDATMLGVALAGSRLADPDEPTVVVDTPEAAAPAVPVAAPPEWLDDDLVVETDESTAAGAAGPDALLVAVLAVLVGGGAAFAYSELSTPSHTIPDLRGLDRGGGARRSRSARVRGRAAGEPRGRIDAGRRARHPTRGRRGARRGRHAHPHRLAGQHAGAGAHRPGRQDPRGGHADPRRRRRLHPRGHPRSSRGRSRRTSSSGSARACRPSCPRAIAVPLIVSSGPAPRTVPSGLVGGTFDQAQAALEACS